MIDTLIPIVMLILFLVGTGTVLCFFASSIRRAPGSHNILKATFIISQGLALVILFYLMDVERNLIPILGFCGLLAVLSYCGWVMIGLLTISPNERTQKDKKSLKVGSRIFYVSTVLFISWLIIWWSEIYS